MSFSLKQVLEITKHFGCRELTDNEIIEFINTEIKIVPRFKHNLKDKIIFVEESEVELHKEELLKWKQEKWIIQTTFNL